MLLLALLIESSLQYMAENTDMSAQAAENK